MAACDIYENSETVKVLGKDILFIEKNNNNKTGLSKKKMCYQYLV